MLQIIDLFAGPGGLGEGFCAYKHKRRNPFKIAISIEKELFAHKTLELRAFFRTFKKAPNEYYHYLQGKISREDLFRTFPINAKTAATEAWHAELGANGIPHKDIASRIRAQLIKGMPTILIGGPPCQAYSLVGRVKMQGGKDFENDPRHTLYLEYLKIIDEFHPEVFVMENVKGILSSKLNGERIFKKILRDLECPGKALGNTRNARYKIYSLCKPDTNNIDKDFVIKSENYGIPQARHRVILLGVREDIKIKPEALKEAKNQITVRQVIEDLPKLRSGLSKQEDSFKEWKKLLSNFDQKFKPKPSLTRGGEFITHEKSISSENPLASWYLDSKIKGVIDHETRSHISQDLKRYNFISRFALEYGYSPKLEHMPDNLLPNHKNVKSAIKSGSLFNDRFRVQVAGKPATTITSHISKDGHYFIHYDPNQSRSLTVREAARLQTFPDNYKFEGPRTSQYQQVGNAVPPYLAMQIAEVVFKILER